MTQTGGHSAIERRGLAPRQKPFRGLLFRAQRAWRIATGAPAWIRRAWADGFGLRVPAGFEDIADQQARSLRATAFALSVCGTNAIVLVMADFWHQTGTFGMAVASCIVGVYATWIALVYCRASGRWFMHASTVLLAVQGTLWGVMVYLLAGVAVGQQSNFVVAIALGLVSTPVLSAPFSIAIAFWLPVAIGGELAIAYGLKGNDHYLAGTILGYEVLVLVGIVVINRTLMQLSVARMKLKQQNQTVGLLLRDYEENAADWLWETDSDGRLRHITPRFAQVLRASPREIEGRLFAEVLNLGAANDADHETAAMLRAMAAGRPFRDIPVRLRIAGEERWLSLTGRPVLEPDTVFAGYRGVGSDITSAKRAAEETRYLATHDALTGIGNRRMFIDRLERACASRTGTQPQPFALLMLDLDRFKEVNDDHGHSSGDTVLLETACRIAAAMRPSDTVARLGGDEFALIMPNAGAREATGKAERLIEVISDRIRVDDAWLSVGASIGVALFPRDGKSVVEIMRNADLALYRAKEAGRGTCRVFEASFGVEFQDRVALLTELRAAINTEDFQIDYQPIVHLATQQIISLEALCRWTHPERGPIPPSVFIPLAEECGLIRALGRGILFEACRAAAGWNEAISVSVNISPVQLKDPFLVAIVTDVLTETGLDPRRLEVEITESTWLKADVQTSRQVQALSELGVRIVLDDFGTGFSSLSTLRNFCFHGLKIDAEFVRNIEADPKAEAILRLVSAMATELGVSLTAEGIETEGQLRMVEAFGIARAQGYLLGQPGQYAADDAGLPMRVAAQ
jgi:diguanylate cyclase (GGDEF)-like protein/PAS domain S-box-containing protein